MSNPQTTDNLSRLSYAAQVRADNLDNEAIVTACDVLTRVILREGHVHQFVVLSEPNEEACA